MLVRLCRCRVTLALYTQVVGYEQGRCRATKSERAQSSRTQAALAEIFCALSKHRLRRLKLNLARRHNAFPNSLVHPLQQPLLLHCRASAASVFVQQRVIRHVDHAVRTLSARPQRFPRLEWPFLSRLSCHDCSQGVAFHELFCLSPFLLVSDFCDQFDQRGHPFVAKSLLQ